MRTTFARINHACNSLPTPGLLLLLTLNLTRRSRKETSRFSSPTSCAQARSYLDRKYDPSLPAKVLTVLTGGEKDDDATISIRFHGRCFDIKLSPTFFQNSPKPTDLYLKYLRAIEPFGPGEFEDIYDEHDLLMLRK
ncbi:hypothetical protein GGS20DRAFT_556381 [Poronia punctata]|nr:hypothetical protein GGS20DRAFT_556381 [Poronia punctata]